ncbi:MAG: D-glycero-beta-D-manno-heptose-7-phosphate kinase [Candidatus Omnitrophica bacterium]|nr:D-glycero-beta-D-manno-heptose-7-phosphate kinase [Candidatus Omnitrophota bacterium]
MKRLKDIVKKFKKARILVIGDLILDEYVWGKVDRISPEAPVPVVWANKMTHVPGGAANVANNISSYGAAACLTGVIGQDRNAVLLRKALRKGGIDTKGITVIPQRCTTVKTRIIAGHQQVVRVDWEHTEPLSKEIVRKIFNFIKTNIKSFDAIIIEDYGKGVINAQLLEGLILLAQSYKKIILVDPKEDHFQYYRGVTAITPNCRELENAVRNLKIKDNKNKLKLDSDKLFTDRDIEAAGEQIMEYLGLDSLLVTLGEHGIKLFEKKGIITHIPTVTQEVFDVSGAGDTVIATFALSLAVGATKIEAAHIANYAAGIVVGKIGTATVNKDELLERLG